MKQINAELLSQRASIENLNTLIQKNELDSFESFISSKMNLMMDRVIELEEFNSSCQKSYLQRLTKLIETRKTAESSFMEERKRFTSIIKDLENAFQKKNEVFQVRLQKEMIVMKDAYDKLKDENGRFA